MYRTYCHCTGFEQGALLSCAHNSHGVAGAADHLLNIEMAVCRIHWPQGQLVVPPEGVVQLLGHQLSGKGPVQEWLVTGTTTAHTQDRIGVAFLGQAISRVTADDELCVIMQPTVGWRAAPVPVVLLPRTASSDERTAQVVLYDHVPSLQQPALHASVQSARGRMQLAACLAARLCFLLTALWLLQHRQLLASAAGRGGSQLARFVHAQLLWFMSAQPAGKTCLIYCPGLMICSARNAAACPPASLPAQCNTASPPLPLPPAWHRCEAAPPHGRAAEPVWPSVRVGCATFVVRLGAALDQLRDRCDRRAACLPRCACCHALHAAALNTPCPTPQVWHGTKAPPSAPVVRPLPSQQQLLLA